MTRTYWRGLLLVCAALLVLHTAPRAADSAPGDFTFPPDIAAQEEAAAQGQPAAPPAAPPPATPAAAPHKPAAAKAGAAKPAAHHAPAAPVGPAPQDIQASSRPLQFVDYSLTPEELDDAGSHHTALQQMLLAYADAGQSSVGDMVKLISSSDGGQLDHIIINIANQRIYECNASGQALREEPVSTGMKGLDTPPGDYTVHNKAPKAYSQKYTAWMLQWMALTDDGNYGMHGLEGSNYERRLGRQASHGCVRLSRKYAKDLYPRVKVGLPVKIVNDKDLKLSMFQPLSEQAATAQVLDVLSPADPDALFY